MRIFKLASTSILSISIKRLTIYITIALSSISAQAITLEIDMSSNPLDSGWGLYNSNNGSSSVTNGILTVNSTGYYELIAPDIWSNTVTAELGWVLETRMRVVVGANYLNSYASAGIWLYDNPGVKQLAFFSDKAGIQYPKNATTPVDTSIFRNYRYEALGNRITMYVDGVQMLDQSLTYLGGGSNTFMFGDLGGSGATVSEWDYIRLTFEEGTPYIQPPTPPTEPPSYVPLPAAVYLFLSGLAGMGFLIRRS